ncbi:MAG: aldo/keto reductase [Syntrophobacterales bacterium]|nr:aldo/keto reductase [Syntrophobacterales bacterium]
MGEYVTLGDTALKVSRLVFGTWVTGGWAWGGSDEKEALEAIIAAFERGINVIDTAPVYGFGRSEEIVGKALKTYGRREEIVVATKCGLQWSDGGKRIWRDSKPKSLYEEVDKSLNRLKVDWIDIYQIHWPDEETPFEDSMEALMKIRDTGKIRFIGLSNFEPSQIERCLRVGPVHSLQPPYNMFEREAEEKILPYCIEKGIPTLVYGGLCRGLLTGKFKGTETFPKGDLRRHDPKFKAPLFQELVRIVEEIRSRIKPEKKYGKTMAQFALRWTLQRPGVTTVIVGARNPAQAIENCGALGWTIDSDDMATMEEILLKCP